MDSIVELNLMALAISGIASSWMICHLMLLRCQAKVTHRLFWVQLLVLAANDLTWALASSIPYFFPEPSAAGCTVIYMSHQTCEYASCLLEVQIASGFAAACFRWGRVVRGLWITVWFSVPMGLIIAVTTLSTESISPHDGLKCDISHQMVWSIVVLSCCALTFVVNFIGLLGTVRTPRIVFSRAKWRAWSYTLSFALTIGVKALVNLVAPSDTKLDYAAWFMLCFSGLAHVLNYAWQNRQARAGAAISSRVTFPVTFRAPASGNMEVHASVLEYSPSEPDLEEPEHYFDFDREVRSSENPPASCA